MEDVRPSTANDGRQPTIECQVAPRTSTQSVYMFTHAIVSVDGSIVAAYAASDIQVEYVAHENMA
jgi:hypothetical protein